MIPASLKTLVEKQVGDFRRNNFELVSKQLRMLGIKIDTEFSEFYLAYTVSTFYSRSTGIELLDIAEPSPQIEYVTQFAHEVWELPTNFVCFSSVEGEGGYLYDKNTGKVWDFSLATRQNFIDGKEKPRWNSFFEFMIWYLS